MPAFASTGTADNAVPLERSIPCDFSAPPPVWAGILMAAATGCSAPDATTFIDGGAAVPCLFCTDSGSDMPVALRVKGRIDQICSSPDGCHGQGQAGLSLSYGNEFAPLINVPSTQVPTLLLVAPGDPARSYAYRKIACDGGYVLSCMPKGARFDANLAQLFFDWIEAGAPTQ